MTLGEIMQQIKDKGQTKEDQVRFLRKKRVQLLDEIHCKQQLLDQLDYMIHELKKN